MQYSSTGPINQDSMLPQKNKNQDSTGYAFFVFKKFIISNHFFYFSLSSLARSRFFHFAMLISGSKW
jgi:hypothetical protein